MNAPKIDEAVKIAAELCRHFEGFRGKPYICPAGYPTIGYGTVYKPDGTRVTMDDPPISKAQADEWLLSELQSLSDTLVLPSIGCELPVAEIYLKVPLGDSNESRETTNAGGGHSSSP